MGLPKGADPPVLFFDGVCNFCNRSVQFVLRRNSELRFAPLQSAAAQQLLLPWGVKPSQLATVVLLEKDRCSTESAAILRLARYLPGLWPLLRILVVIPRPIRDWVYRYFARHRYQWFGRRESCRVPTPEERARFLE